MPENLWDIRRRKKMKVRDLAAKAGVPVSLIHQYEAGDRSISHAHMRQLARALIVEPWDINPLSDPKPHTQGQPSTRRAPARAKPSREPRSLKQPKTIRPPAPARQSQIEHFLHLAERFPDVDRASVEAQVAKPLEELTAKEAGEILHQLQVRIQQEQPPRRCRP